MTAQDALTEEARLFAEFGAGLAGDPAGVLDRITATAVAQVPGAQAAGITRQRGRDRYESLAPTSDVVLEVDRIQYEVGHGPCVDAVRENTSFVTDDLATDPRWPGFASRAVEATGVRSMLTFRMFFDDTHGLSAALNLYSVQRAAFDARSARLGLIVATHGALGMAYATAQQSADGLRHAVRSNRQIGMAVGILMALHRVTQEQAFDLLRVTSQNLHRKVADLADEVVHTGVLPARRPPSTAG